MENFNSNLFVHTKHKDPGSIHLRSDVATRIYFGIILYAYYAHFNTPIYNLSIQAIHPFRNGNGRTGRTVYNLLTQTNPPIEDRDKFSESCVRPPQFIYNEIYRLMIPELFGEIFFKKYGNIHSYLKEGFVNISDHDIPKSLKIEAGDILGESAGAPIVNRIKFRDITLLRFLQQKKGLDLTTSPYHPFSFEPKIFYGEDEGKKIFSVDGESLVKDMNKKDLEMLVATHRELKTLFIQKLIDVIINPNEYKKGGKPIKDEFFAI